jgi:glycosyltransferase involved in cell wall biosynthesis
VTKRHDDLADVVLVLEGTYPFVMGGVSSWVHRLVTRMPDLRFGVVHIAPREGYYGTAPAYKLPPNVVFLEEIGLLPRRRERTPLRQRRHRRAIAKLWDDLLRLRSAEPEALVQLGERIAGLSRAGIGPDDVLTGDAAWQALVGCYEAEAADQSFINFFWTWRFAHQPLIELLFRRVPRGGMYHTVSTGYAGLLAAVASACWQRPMILTEHGIYTKERRIEIYSANWIHDAERDDLVVDSEAPYFRQFWNRHFEVMSACCYRQATRIFTLYGQNRDAQVADGADPARIDIIPNGVDLEALTKAREAAPPRPADQPFTVAFIGRVTPIKDVRTFLAAMRLVAREVPDVVVRVLGPMQEDPDYAHKCKVFAEELGLGGNVRFEGAVDIKQELPKIDVLLLTSISEAQPLVVLEAGAFGVPVVATDVGSCRELLEGRTAADQAIGTGGLLAPIASPGVVARRVLELHADPELRLRMGRNLQERVRRFYDEKDMIEAYRAVYGRCLQPAGAG